MRFLIDENLPYKFCRWFKARGLDAVHVNERGAEGRPDDLVIRIARREDRIVVTKDRDYLSPLAEDVQVVLTHLRNAPNSKLIAHWERHWSTVEKELTGGTMLVELPDD